MVLKICTWKKILKILLTMDFIRSLWNTFPLSRRKKEKKIQSCGTSAVEESILIIHLWCNMPVKKHLHFLNAVIRVQVQQTAVYGEGQEVDTGTRCSEEHGESFSFSRWCGFKTWNFSVLLWFDPFSLVVWFLMDRAIIDSLSTAV